MRKILVLVAVATILGWGTAWADTTGVATDPEVLHIGTGVGTPCQSGGCYVYGNEVNGVGTTTVDIWENGNGQPALINPVLLIIGIPNATSGEPTGVTLSGTGTGTLGNGGVPIYGWNGNGSAGSWQPVNTTQNVYDFLSLDPGGSNSEHFASWQAADLAANGISASSFGVFVYTLFPDPQLAGGAGVDITFNSALPNGTFLVAYGCSAITAVTSETPTATKCDGTGDTFSTPFTESGDASGTVPEPGTLTLLGTGLLSLAGILRRRLKA